MRQTAATYSQIRHTLQHAVRRLIAVTEAEDADNWGADVFRRLLSYARTVELDVDADLYIGAGCPAALRRLNALGTELALQRWAEPSNAAEYQHAVVVALEAVGNMRDHLHARSDGDPAT